MCRLQWPDSHARNDRFGAAQQPTPRGAAIISSFAFSFQAFSDGKFSMNRFFHLLHTCFGANPHVIEVEAS